MQENIEQKNSNLNDRDIEFTLQKAGLKVTPQRIAIYRALAGTNEHPCAQRVYSMVKEQYPNISFDTVNRTLLTLADIGAALVVEGSGDVKRFDGDTTNHQHIKCIKCKRIIDFHYEPFDNIDVPEFIAKNFSVHRKTVYLEGICNECRGVKGQRLN